MATASSVQREPSMEEILASIRRIIEDSDTGRKQPGDADELRQDLQPAPAAAEGDAFRSELRGGLEIAKPATRAEVQPAAAPVIERQETPLRPGPIQAAVTLAEVNAAPEPPAKPDRPATAKAAETTDTIIADWRREIAAVGDAMAKPERAEPLRTPDAEPKAEVFENEATAGPVPEPSEIGPELSESGPESSKIGPESSKIGLARPAASEAPPARPAILSEHTGRQVAAAFGELSDAFASRSKKTFDEMAEEMLRPMLQDWLDNNLPTLVERLVREEIERVARGAQ
ncbi:MULTISPECIES: PopZ family protein [unclassified Mesorhizobium]|uniref:PopZ family protein n=1 Tax=unclassified Mesorhizobium TaxID=325217 RepID=UPI003337DFBF